MARQIITAELIMVLDITNDHNEDGAASVDDDGTQGDEDEGSHHRSHDAEVSVRCSRVFCKYE